MALFDLFSTDPAKDAARKRIAGAREGEGAYLSELETGYGQARADLNQARGVYGDLRGIGRSGVDAYGDFIGLGGAEGYDRAVDRFRTSPGYEFARDEGLKALDRRASAAGRLNSGLSELDALRYATGYADQEYDDFLSRYDPYFGLLRQGTQGEATSIGALADLSYDKAKRRGDIRYRTETGIGDYGADAELARYNTSANKINFGLGLASLAMGGYGG